MRAPATRRDRRSAPGADARRRPARMSAPRDSPHRLRLEPRGFSFIVGFPVAQRLRAAAAPMRGDRFASRSSCALQACSRPVCDPARGSADGVPALPACPI
ncbi:conserved hypothetical protein [Burkholderia pseudomallei 576]|nr:conserved hypothetical protein [Burkholderia pseudomallei 576]